MSGGLNPDSVTADRPRANSGASSGANSVDAAGGFFRRRLIQPVVELLTQGITPEKIALSLAMGIGLGIFPVLGSTMVLCAAAAFVFRLNLPAIQLVNWFVYPLQLLLIVPFIRAGEFLFRSQRSQLSLPQMLAMARADLPHAISVLWIAGLRAVVAWTLVGPVAIFLLYLALSYFVRRLAGGVRAGEVQADDARPGVRGSGA